MKRVALKQILVALTLLSLVLTWDHAFGSSSPSVHKRSKSDRDVNSIGRRNIAYKGNWFSIDKETQIATQSSAVFERSYPLVHDPVSDTYLEGLAQKIARNSDAKIPITVRVIDSTDAFAVTLPGGYQYVTRGLLLAVDDEGGLASIIARGIAHTGLRSETWNQSRANLIQVMTLPLIFAGNPSSYSGASLAVPLTMLKYQREEETDADYFGVQYMYKAGYDPECFLRAVQAIWSLPLYSNVPLSFSSFPPLSLRLTAVRKEIDKILPKRTDALTTTPEFEEFRKHLLSLAPAEQQPTSEPKLVRVEPTANN